MASPKETGHFGRRRRPVDLLRGAGLRSPSSEHDDDVIAQGQCLVLIVGDQNRRRSRLAQDLGNLGADLASKGDVERGEGFVEQDRPRSGGQGPGHCDPLRLSTGEFVRAPLLITLQANQGQHLGHSVAPLPPLQSEAHVAGNIQMREQGELLEHEPHPPMLGGHPCVGADDLFTFHPHVAVVGLLQIRR